MQVAVAVVLGLMHQINLGAQAEAVVVEQVVILLMRRQVELLELLIWAQVAVECEAVAVLVNLVVLVVQV